MRAAVRGDKCAADIVMVAPTLSRVVDALHGLNRLPGFAVRRFAMNTGRGLFRQSADRDLALHRAGVRFTHAYLQRAYDFRPGEVPVEECCSLADARLAAVGMRVVWNWDPRCGEWRYVPGDT